MTQKHGILNLKKMRKAGMSRKLKGQESVRGGSAPTTCNPGKRFLGNRLVGGMPASLFQEIPIQGNGGSGDRGKEEKRED